MIILFFATEDNMKTNKHKRDKGNKKMMDKGKKTRTQEKVMRQHTKNDKDTYYIGKQDVNCQKVVNSEQQSF